MNRRNVEIYSAFSREPVLSRTSIARLRVEDIDDCSSLRHFSNERNSGIEAEGFVLYKGLSETSVIDQRIDRLTMTP